MSVGAFVVSLNVCNILLNTMDVVVGGKMVVDVLVVVSMVVV